MRAAVVGGGIAGLTAAWTLAGTGWDVTIYEPGPLGGKLRTTDFAGRPVEEGPDAFLTRTPEGADLCAEIGVADLVAPAAGRTLLWTRGRLRPLPDGLVLGVPGRLAPIVRSGLLGPAGLARAGLDLVLPRRRYGDDVSAGRLVADRFGHQVADRLVEPLLGSIHAAPLDELSASVVAPQILAAARSSRSLLLGLRHLPAPPVPGGDRPPLFLTPVGGLGRMVEALDAGLRRRGVVIRAEAATAVRGGTGPVRVSGAGGPEDFDAAVVAVPAPAAAGLLGPAAPAGLGDIAFTSVAVVTAAVPPGQWSPPPGYNGFLVPPRDGRLMTACSFWSNKWPDGPGRPGGHLVRLSAGRHGDGRIESMTDDALAAALVAELGAAVGATVRPAEVRVSRWPASFPLYRVGHTARVERMEAELASFDRRIVLAGASYRGAGIPACIRSGRDAAGRLGAPEEAASPLA